MQNWKQLEYSKTQVINAGKSIKSLSSPPEDRTFALSIIDNWRASHAYPLHVFYCNLSRKYNKPGYIVAQRLKRLSSIVSKLSREPRMSLWTMQDLGGCRVIAPTVDDVYSIVEELKQSRIRHTLEKEYDYIIAPKRSGYRSYHMVYKYHSDKKQIYNRNMLIEIQIRTKIQHLWATAVETIGLFTNQALKASQGQKEILSFFILTASLFAIREGQPLVPGSGLDKETIVRKINFLDQMYNILNMLRAFRVAADHYDEKMGKRSGYYILILNYETRNLRFKYYLPNEIDRATSDYNQIESGMANQKIDAVLVSVASFTTLKAAYPNYFLDIREFINIVEEEITSY